MSGTPPPPGFEQSRIPTPEQLMSLPGISREDLDLLQGCIDMHHIAAIDYTDAKGHRSTILLRPGYIRLNSANHMVVWGIPTNSDHWEELRFDLVNGVRGTGEVFQPPW